MTIISDGPYGINGFPGDPANPDNLGEIYLPHIKAWSTKATSNTTLWFWCTEIGWALVHPYLVQNGWIYRGCNIWDKGISHIAGNCNGKTMKKFPVVTEVCAHYVRQPIFVMNNDTISLQEWFRNEWIRSGLPFNKANEACGVKNAASRKYLTSDNMWYTPPANMFSRMALYANTYGDVSGTPYFNLTEEELTDENLVISKWEKIQAKFNFEYGATNVWQCPSNRGVERLKINGKSIHMNQKPEILLERIIKASTDINDVIWDVFCGTGAGSLVALKLNRSVFTAEINNDFYEIAKKRIDDFVNSPILF